MNKRAIPRSKAKKREKSASELERFEEPYWGETPKLTPEQIVEWLEGHREMMMLIKNASNSSGQKS